MVDTWQEDQNEREWIRIRGRKVGKEIRSVSST